MITHFTITPQCLDCDNPEEIVFTITVTNDTEEELEYVVLEVGPEGFGALIADFVAKGFGSATHGTWDEEADYSVWDIPLLDSQETATTTVTLLPGVEGADFCGLQGQFLPVTLIATLPDHPTTPPVSATLQLCEDPPPPPPPPTLQPPGSGRNTPIARVSERNGLTVFFPGETDRTCIQGTCPVAVGGRPECVKVTLGGFADMNEISFVAPGFEWGVTPSFALFPPGGAGAWVSFEWSDGAYRSESSAGCGDGKPEEGWTFTLGESGPPPICAIVQANCQT